MDMNRVILSIFLAATALLLIASHDSLAAHNHLPSTVAPSTIEYDGGTLDLSQMRGKEVVVTLWSSNDAASRLENMTYAAQARRDSSIEHIGINLDESPELHLELLKRDRLTDDSLQLHASGDAASRLLSTYGHTSLHIDAQGRMIN